jgi:copper chaperone CopZ
MRQLFAMLTVGLATAALGAAGGGALKVEVKGPHVCCKQCVRVVSAILDKVDGVSDVKADIKSKTVTFTAKDNKAAEAGFKALRDGGFWGKATAGDKQLTVAAAPAINDAKADSITVKDVHVCCGQCQSAINKLFKGSKVTYEGAKGNPQKTVRIEGKELVPSEVLKTLHQGGFNGVLP